MLNFKDQLVLFLNLTNDKFDKNYFNLCVNFCDSKISVSFFENKKFNIKKHIPKYIDKKVIYIKARKEAFNYIVKTKSSWEDLGIGFQIRVYRYPNKYNFKFVEHFQYKYLNPENKKTTGECSICTSLNHLIDEQITRDVIVSKKRKSAPIYVS